MLKLSDVLKDKRRDIDGAIANKEKWIREGYIIVPNVLTLDKSISPQAKILFLALCVHAFKKDYAFPSYEVLQEELGLARPQLIRYLGELQQVGLVKVQRTGRANNYELVYEALDERADDVAARLKKLKAVIDERRNGEK
jgi:hypothetical protein